MSTFLPMFPLQLVVFPDENLNLHIFEPRYKQLIRECETQGITFGIPTYLNGKVMDIGTEVKLLSIEKRYPSGEMDIKTQGLGTFKIQEFYKIAPERLYAGADVERLETQPSEGDYVLAEQVLNAVRDLFDLLNVQKELPDVPNAFRTFDWAHHVGLSTEQEYTLLCLADENQRLKYLKSHLDELLPRVREVEEVRRKAQMNGHFKNVIPPDL